LGTPQAGVQNVIILLSDGDANASAGNVGSGKAYNQCHAAISAAGTAKGAGTWVYSIAYDADTSSSGSCTTDQPDKKNNPKGVAISACATMQQIATSGKFYTDSSGGGSSCGGGISTTNLNSAFANIAVTLQQPRLLPNNTT
jgi:hypothetical protein